MNESPPPLPEIPTYEARLSLLEKHTLYKIVGGFFRIEREINTREIPLSQIQSLRCRYFPTRFQTDRYEIILTTAQGEQIKIGNQYFRGLADFEDRSPEFRAFVIALHENLMNEITPCRFFAGVTPLSFWLNAVFLGSVLIILAILVVLFAATIPGVAIIKLILLIFMIPIAINWFRKNRPREYHGPDIPENVIPS